MFTRIVQNIDGRVQQQFSTAYAFNGDGRITATLWENQLPHQKRAAVQPRPDRPKPPRISIEKKKSHLSLVKE
jgi:hypothetical protein